MKKIVLLFVYLCVLNLNAENSTLPPLSETLKYIPGLIEGAGEGRSKFSSTSMSPQSGAIQCWVKLNKKAESLKYNHLWGFGYNQPGWFTAYVSKGNFSVTVKNDSRSSNISIDISKWKIGEWHNLAVCWGIYQKKPTILIYEDGVLCAKLSKASLPSEFNSGSFSLGFNSAHVKGDNFAGAVDELAVYSLPLKPEHVKNNFLYGKKEKALIPEPGTVLLAHFNGDANWQAGGESTLEGKALKKYLRAALKTPSVKKYNDELDVKYNYDRDMKEKSAKILTDGSDRSIVVWKNHLLEVVFELPYTADLNLIEIATPKPTIWYRLEELHISLDKGNGEFSAPEIIKTYGESPKQTKNVRDKTCKTYLYKWEKPGKACRVKIVLKGKGYMALGEVRICGKAVTKRKGYMH